MQCSLRERSNAHFVSNARYKMQDAMLATLAMLDTGCWIKDKRWEIGDGR